MKWDDTGQGNYAQSSAPVGCTTGCFLAIILWGLIVLAVVLVIYW